MTLARRNVTAGFHAGWRCAVPVCAAVCVAALAISQGCVKPILSPEDERSPFDRYDGIRAQYAPQYITDEYGQRVPNLRMRLTPKD